MAVTTGLPALHPPGLVQLSQPLVSVPAQRQKPPNKYKPKLSLPARVQPLLSGAVPFGPLHFLQQGYRDRGAPAVAAAAAPVLPALAVRLRALHSLELCQGHNVAALGPVPHRLPRDGIVVVEAVVVVIEELPPLLLVRLAHLQVGRGLPAAFTGGQVDVHPLLGAGLDDLHPVRAVGE